MSDKANSGHDAIAEAPPRETDAAGRPVARLINATVRDYMDALSLQRFYGGYVITKIDEQVFNLGIGEVGGIDLPEDLYSIYRRFEQSDALAPLATRYSGTLGERDTNRLMAAHLNQWLGEERFNEMRVVSLDGGQNAIEVAVRAFTAPLGSAERDKHYVLMATPSYPYFSAVISAHTGIMSFLAYDGEAFTRGVETYCNGSVGLILINVPHNPMGYTLDAGQVARIGKVAEAYDCVIVVDGVYANYPDSPRTGQALAGFDPHRTVFCDSFSKKYGLPGLRLGFALSAAEELTYAMRFIKMSESLTPSNGKLAFAGHLLEHHSQLPSQIGAQVRERRRQFLERFDPGALKGVRVFGEENNPFYLALDIAGLCQRAGMTDVAVATHCLEQYQVRVFPGAFVYPNRKLRHGVFSAEGRLNPHGPAPYLAPRFPPGEQIVFSGDHLEGRTPLLRLSFGAENRTGAAAEALTEALQSLQ
ncbi:MAG: pyridoxal phosphate-dependent aminotransferase [SAR324 cluster bacterium]|nr:pyridoxal phosphate-dependent aminotransferase [SAR324 cluster bacterium]